MEKVTTINILGTCISRDTFSTHADDGSYLVQQYVNEFDPFYFGGKGMEVDKERYFDYDTTGLIPPFRKRCMYLDATKTIMDYIKEKDSDFLLIDAAICRMPTLRVGDTFISVSRNRADFFRMLKEEGIIHDDVAEELRVPCEEFEERLRSFSSEVLKVYPPEKIVLIELQGSYVHYNGKVLTPFGGLDNLTEKNKRMKLGFELLKEQLAGCHIVPMLDAVVADTNHWLKTAFIHYTREYYDYAYECMNVIAKKLPRDEEELEIRRLHRDYTQLYYKKFFNMLALDFAQSTVEKENALNIERKRKEHLNLQAKLLGSIADKAVYREDTDISISSAIIYGWSRVSEYLLKLLANKGIKPVAVVENLEQTTIGAEYFEGGVPLLNRASKLPPADCVVVSDMINADKIVPRLKATKKWRIFTAEEFARLFIDF